MSRFKGRGRDAAAIALVFLFIVGAMSWPAMAEMVLRRGNGTEPQTLDVALAQGTPSSHIQRDLFEGLIAEKADGTLIPGAAERWQISKDGLVYTFHLRPDGRWSNGDPVTAQDFEFALKRLVDPATAAPYSFIVNPILNAPAISSARLKDVDALGVKALDNRTLEITLSKPTPYFIGLLTHSTTFPVHRKSILKNGKEWIKPGKLVSNGAYKLIEWEPQSHIKLVKNPYFHDARHVRIDTVYYLNTEDVATEVKRYRAGELDYTSTVALSALKWVKEHIPDELHSAPGLLIQYYDINMRRKKFKDPRVRKALMLAVDRRILVDKILHQGQIPAFTMVPPIVANHQPWQPAWASMSQAERLALANNLMHEAGYSRDHPLDVEILYNTSDSIKKLAIAIAAMWKRIGVKTTLRNEEWKALINSRNLKHYEIARDAWVGDYNDPYTFLEIFRADAGPMNTPDYRNPEFDVLLDAANRELDLTKRATLMRRAEQVLIDDLPVIPLYFGVNTHLVKPYVKGYANSAGNWHPTRWMWIDKSGPGQNVAR